MFRVSIKQSVCVYGGTIMGFGAGAFVTALMAANPENSSSVMSWSFWAMPVLGAIGFLFQSFMRSDRRTASNFLPGVVGGIFFGAGMGAFMIGPTAVRPTLSVPTLFWTTLAFLVTSGIGALVCYRGWRNLTAEG